jgi:capsular polysaccharide biosynthesis protein
LFCLRGSTDTRQILNESEVALLAESHGYQIVDCATLTVAEQATLFARAAIITGAHGAAFTNIVFANRGTLIHEWFPATYENNCFEQIAHENGLAYQKVLFPCDDSEGHSASINLQWAREILLQIESCRGQ